MKVNIQPNTPEWLQFRRTKVMASDAPIIMGDSPWCTPLELYHRKVSDTEQPVTPAMQRGINLESDARREFEILTGYFVYPEMHTSDLYPWMGATFDGINEDLVVVEIKCPGKKDHETALEGKVPVKYWAQLQHQIAVAGITEMYYFSYNPDHLNPTALLEVKIDEIYLQEIIRKEKEFYECLINQVKPEVNLNSAKMDDEELLKLERRLLTALEQKEIFDAETDFLKKAILEKMGDSEFHGDYLIFKPTICRGAVDYKRLCEEKGITDVEEYRKESFQKWTVKPISSRN